MFFGCYFLVKGIELVGVKGFGLLMGVVVFIVK